MPAHTPTTVQAPLGFLHPENRLTDPDGVLRAPTHQGDASTYQAPDRQFCTLHDCAAGGDTPQLEIHGFETLGLSHLTGLQASLQRVMQAGRLDDEDSRHIRRALSGQRFSLGNGKQLRILFIAGDGLLLRRSGPNGLRLDPEAAMTAHNGHEPAASVHADQDVYGTPLRQMLWRLAPRLFRHESPNDSNRRSPLFLLNLWIPLRQVVRPLVFMDQRSLDRRRHQLRYDLPVADFLKRSSNQSHNATWAFLHHPEQRWHFDSTLDHHRAWLFNTLGTPHGATVLPGEALAETLYRQLAALCTDMPAPLMQGIDTATPPNDTPRPLVQAIRQMQALLQEALQEAQARRSPDWQQRTQAALQRVERQSLEMRLVAWVR